MDQIATLQVVSASCLRQDPAKTIELASRALERPPVENRMASFIARCEVLYNLGFAYYLTGELSKAEQTYQEAKRAARQIGFLLRDILVTHKLAHIHQVSGRLHQPYHLYQETLAFMQKQGKEEFFGMGYLYCGMSNLLYEWNRLEEAQQMVAESLRLNEMAPVPHLLIDSYNAQARLLITQRDLDAAQTALQKAADLIQKYYCWPEVIGANESYQVRLWLAKGDLTSAIRWIQERQLAESEALSFMQELAEIARARILIAQDLLNEATDLLSRLAKSAGTGGRHGRLIEILVLEAVARQARGELKQAIARLEQALSLAEPEGYIRTFVDEGAPVAALLSEIIGNRRSPHAPYVHRLLAAFGIEVDDQGRTVRVADSSRSTPTLRPSPWVEPLSERELEVLQCIAAGLSNAEIAQQLVIAVSTVKRHINHIFGKLGVTSRTQALVKAKELGLL